MKTTGEKIRERRTHLGLTQTELANKIGVTLRTITKYEKQGVMPRGRNLRELAKVLGVSEVYLANEEIEDETYGLEEAPYIDSVRAAYGAKGANDMQNLLLQQVLLQQKEHRNKKYFFCQRTTHYLTQTDVSTINAGQKN